MNGVRGKNGRGYEKILLEHRILFVLPISSAIIKI